MSERAPSTQLESDERSPLASATRHYPPREGTAADEATQNPCAELDRMGNLVDTIHGDLLPQQVQQQLTAAVIGLDMPPAETCGVKG
ncbi:hypothetical protein [Streptomyces mirabilis]|uniref:hypothetical protein n=1 Tax=Streptomyces mirabilis TaxID=68239 RepID=UPI0036A4BE1C